MIPNQKPVEYLRGPFRRLPGWARAPLWVLFVLCTSLLLVGVAPIMLLFWGLELLPSLYEEAAPLYTSPQAVAQEIAAWAEREGVQPPLLRDALGVLLRVIRQLRRPVGPSRQPSVLN